jgi:imidazolonepropionase-like amidohydrolase
MKKYLILLLGIMFSSDQIPAPNQFHPILLRNGFIHTVSNGTVHGPDILFDDGKIVAIGHGIEIPNNTKIIDVKGKHIYPGLISAGSTLGLQEVNAVRATRDYAETGSINPNVRANVSYHPDSELIPVSRSNGVLVAHVIPQSGRISGTSSAMLLDGWTWEDCTLKHPVAMNLNWPAMDLSFSSWNKKSIKDQEKSRLNALNEIDQLFNSARAYNKLNKENLNFKSNPRLASLTKVTKGEIPLIIKANSVKQIESAIYWSVEQNIDIIILGGKDAWRTIDLILEKNIPIIFESVLSVPKRRYEDYDQPYKTPMILHEAGVRFCISNSTSSFQTPHIRDLPYHAAMASSFGLNPEEALRAITLSTAEILGIDNKVGSLEVGKDATLFIADGDILDIRTNVEQAYILGKRVDMSDRQKMLYEKYTQKYIQNGTLPNE